MKPPPFEYQDPPTLEEALDLLAAVGDDAVVIAGGQSLVPLLNLRLARPELVVDPRRIDELHRLRFDASGLHAGALVTAAAVEHHPDVHAVPGLAPALHLLGHPQIRNRTTLGGSVAHADPAAELPALLCATEGSITLHSRARGERVVAASSFFEGPFTTTRRPDELLTSVHVPAFAGAMTVLEVAARPGDFATVGVVVGLALPAGTVAEARIVVFGAAGVPERLTSVEAELAGRAGPEAAEAVASLVSDHTNATDDEHTPARYKQHVAGTLAARAVRQLVADETADTTSTSEESQP